MGRCDWPFRPCPPPLPDESRPVLLAAPPPTPELPSAVGGCRGVPPHCTSVAEKIRRPPRIGGPASSCSCRADDTPPSKALQRYGYDEALWFVCDCRHDASSRATEAFEGDPSLEREEVVAALTPRCQQGSNSVRSASMRPLDWSCSSRSAPPRGRVAWPWPSPSGGRRFGSRQRRGRARDRDAGLRPSEPFASTQGDWAEWRFRTTFDTLDCAERPVTPVTR